MSQVKLVTEYDAVRVAMACYSDDYPLLTSKGSVLHESVAALNFYVSLKLLAGSIFQRVEVDSILCGFILLPNISDQPIEYYFRKGKDVYSVSVMTEILKKYPQAKIEKAKF